MVLRSTLAGLQLLGVRYTTLSITLNSCPKSLCAPFFHTAPVRTLPAPAVGVTNTVSQSSKAARQIYSHNWAYGAQHRA